jgi:hypothetical protein
MIGIKTDDFKHPIQGKSLHKLMKDNVVFNRDYIVSESWSQAAIITKDYKLGLMLDPTDFKRKFDYRDFGDMFFDRSNDPLEVQNGILESKYKEQINLLTSYYNRFQQTYPDIGKQQVIQSFIKRK